MLKIAFVWIVARDGSLHLTKPPIMAAGQQMLCGCSYARPDLRVGAAYAADQVPAKACSACRQQMAADTADASGPARAERRTALWP